MWKNAIIFLLHNNFKQIHLFSNFIHTAATDHDVYECIFAIIIYNINIINVSSKLLQNDNNVYLMLK